MNMYLPRNMRHALCTIDLRML